VSVKRQKTQLVLAFMAEGRGEAPKTAGEGTEAPAAKRETEGPAQSERLLEEVCDRANLLKALEHVKANKGGPGVDGMTVGEWPGYLKEHGPILREVNEAKSAVARPWERKFLGFSFTSERASRRRVAPQALARFQERVRDLTRRTRGISVGRMVQEVATYLRGWRGYFGFCQTPSVLRRLDAWLRRRLRSFLWKQWKRGPVRFSELRRRGVGKDLAARTAGSPHGPWRLSASPALSLALPDAFWDSLGLPRLAATPDA
jgi:hypothetical protein